MAGIIDKAVSWAVRIANDDSHKYSQDVRWGPHYDCSSFVISAYKQAGVNIDTSKVYYTGNMRAGLISYGFTDITSSINFFTGAGLKKGDVLINENGRGTSGNGHAALVQSAGGVTVEAKGTSPGIVSSCLYRNYPWDCVLRYKKSSESSYNANWVEREVPNIGQHLATKTYMAYQTYTNNTGSGYNYLWGSDCSTDKGGLRRYKDFICMALGSYYGPDGTFVKIEFSDGVTIYAVKADEKKDWETDFKHQYHCRGGLDWNVTEFIVDGKIVKNSEIFTEALKKAGISRSARVVKIWTSDGEPTSGEGGGSFSYIDEYTGEEKEYHFADTNEKIPIHPSIFKQAVMPPADDLCVIANGNDISRYACDISWTNTKNTLATIFNFSVPKADGMKYLNMYTPKEGEILRYGGENGEYFRGIIKEVDDGDKKINKYVAVDAGWYLNECGDTYQFTDIRADECLKKICADLHIPVVMMTELPTLITQVYADKKISEVIKDILSKCGDFYNFDFVPDGIRFYRCSDMSAEPKFRISSNTELHDGIKYRSGVEHKRSFDGMRNSVKLITDTDVVTVVKDNESISKYGFLQEIVKINEDEEEDTAATAGKKLAELDKIAETLSFEIVEELDSYTRAGYTISVDEKKYVIKSSQHTITNGVHYNRLDLEELKC